MPFTSPSSCPSACHTVPSPTPLPLCLLYISPDSTSDCTHICPSITLYLLRPAFVAYSFLSFQPFQGRPAQDMTNIEAMQGTEQFSQVRLAIAPAWPLAFNLWLLRLVYTLPHPQASPTSSSGWQGRHFLCGAAPAGTFPYLGHETIRYSD